MSLPRAEALRERRAALGQHQHIPFLEPLLAVHATAVDDQSLPAMEVIALRLCGFGELVDRQRCLQFHLRIAAVTITERLAVQRMADAAARCGRENEDGQEYRSNRAVPMGVHDGGHLKHSFK